MNDLSCWETKFKYCCYSKQLLTKLLLLNKTAKPKVDILEIKKAIYYAKKYHGAQLRQSGEPYYSHPLEVAYNIADHVFETNILVTSILHDTIEDTELTKEKIDYIFGSKIANQVESLTRIKSDRKISAAEMVELLWQQKNIELLLVKQFDRLHNIHTINFKSTEKIKTIAEETIDAFIILAIYLEMPTIAEDLIQHCTKIIAPNYRKDKKNYDDSFQLPALSR
jgi:(p)ppGpp synthase/HD superfamily hydrolase